MDPTTYQICVRGRLTERLGSAFEGMTLDARTAESVLTGEVRDQSQLYGLLDRVRDLGLELVSVQPRAVSGAPNDADSSPPSDPAMRSNSGTAQRLLHDLT